MSESHSTLERLSALETRVDQVLSEVSLLRASFVSLEKYLLTHTKEIERTGAEMQIIKARLGYVIGPILGAIGLGAIAAIYLAMKR